MRGVERLEPRSDEHVGVRTGVVGLPRDLPASRVQRGDPAADAELPAAVADINEPVGDQRSHRHGLALVDLAELDLPQLLAALRIHRDGVSVEGVEEHPSVGIGRAAIHHVAARHALRRAGRAGIVLPLLGSGRDVEGVEQIGIRGHDEHGAVGHDRSGLVSAQHAGREGPSELQILRVLGVDLVQRAEPGAGVVPRRNGPIPRLGAGREHRLGSRPGSDRRGAGPTVPCGRLGRWRGFSAARSGEAAQPESARAGGGRNGWGGPWTTTGCGRRTPVRSDCRGRQPPGP